MLEHTLRSLLPAAYGHGVTTEEHAEQTLAALRRDAGDGGGRTMLWPLMIGAWRRRPGGAGVSRITGRWSQGRHR